MMVLDSMRYEEMPKLFGVLILVLLDDGLGPLCRCLLKCHIRNVLILVLLDDGLGPPKFDASGNLMRVLILVLLDDGLGLEVPATREECVIGLNPCSIG